LKPILLPEGTCSAIMEASFVTLVVSRSVTLQVAHVSYLHIRMWATVPKYSRHGNVYSLVT